MYKQHRNVNIHLCFFTRHRFWPLLLPSIAILFLTFCPQLSQSIEINTNNSNQQNDNPDRTVAKLSPREIQVTTTLSPLPLSILPPSSTASASPFDNLM